MCSNWSKCFSVLSDRSVTWLRTSAFTSLTSIGHGRPVPGYRLRWTVIGVSPARITCVLQDSMPLSGLPFHVSNGPSTLQLQLSTSIARSPSPQNLRDLWLCKMFTNLIIRGGSLRGEWPYLRLLQVRLYNSTLQVPRRAFDQRASDIGA